MTLALLTVLKLKSTKQLRKTRKASLQYIFNRMVGEMEEGNEEEDDDEDWDDDGEYYDSEEDEEDEEDEGDTDPISGDDVEPGQNINLMWIGRDPTCRAFPF